MILPSDDSLFYNSTSLQELYAHDHDATKGKDAMSEQPATSASDYLLNLARRNARPYIALPETRAIIVTGSCAQGTSDFYSDLDMIMYYDTLPSEAALQAAYEQNQGGQRRSLGARSENSCAESYNVYGVECQIGHGTIAAWEEDMATVLERLDVASPLQKALSGILESIPLYGETLVAQWQEQAHNFPDALAQAMVKHYLSFFPLWGMPQRFFTRDATLWYYQIVVEAEQHILGVLAGLNRLYYSTFQFKRMRHFIAQMTIVPDNLADHLEAMLLSDLNDVPLLLKTLVEDTVKLVELHMPEIDTAQARRMLAWQEQAWQPQNIM